MENPTPRVTDEQRSQSIDKAIAEQKDLIAKLLNSMLSDKPKSPVARERIDFYLGVKQANDRLPGFVWQAIKYDHEKGYCQLTREDLEYLAKKLGYKKGWVYYKARELFI